MKVGVCENVSEPPPGKQREQKGCHRTSNNADKGHRAEPGSTEIIFQDRFSIWCSVAISLEVELHTPLKVNVPSAKPTPCCQQSA